MSGRFVTGLLFKSKVTSDSFFKQGVTTASLNSDGTGPLESEWLIIASIAGSSTCISTMIKAGFETDGGECNRQQMIAYHTNEGYYMTQYL